MELRQLRFSKIDGGLWERLGGNPVRFLQEVSQQNLIRKANDDSFVENYRRVAERFDRYMAGDDTWFKKNHPSGVNNYIAYFSAEFGLHEVLPVYSGGLGVLSGDHCKSASDLGVPMIAVGLFYMQGYFNQRINHEGWQETYYTNLNPSNSFKARIFSGWKPACDRRGFAREETICTGMAGKRRQG